MIPLHLLKQYFKDNRFILITGLLCLIMVDVLQLVVPCIIKWAVNDITASNIDATKLMFYALSIIAIASLIMVLRYTWRRFLIGTSRKIEEGLRNTLFYHIQTLSASYFDKTKTGDLMAHGTNDIQNIRMAIGMGIVAFTDACVLGSCALGFMAYINIRLTLYVIIPTPMIIFGTRFFSKKMLNLYYEVQGNFANLTEAVREQFAGIRTIKADNLEKEKIIQFEKYSKQYINSNIKLARIVGAFYPMMLFFSNLSLAIILLFGGQDTILATITPGDFVAFISYIGLLTWPMMAIGWLTNLIQRGKASLIRIDNILQTSPQIYDLKNSVNLKTIENGIGFDNVSFSYSSKKNALQVLSNINLQLKKGHILGITGHSGSGKTTLIKLVPRLYNVTNGKILLDGENINNIKTNDLRSHISFVPQEAFLFADTIKKNITFGNDRFTEKELEKAVKAAFVYDTIKSFKNGFETVVGENGIILSGGQKQRITLARALLQDRPFLILDDPVSQVDMETGNNIINTIRSMASYKTIIIVSHRLCALSFADHIIVLDEGKITEQGTHAQLMNNNKYYSNMFLRQKMEEEFHGS